MIRTMTSEYLGLTKEPVQVNRALNRNNFYPLHKHDGFCEVYILLNGSLEHHTNHSVKFIHEPSILFIRESDTHRIQSYRNEASLFYLIKINKDSYKDIIDFFDLASVFNELEEASESPIVPLSKEDVFYLDSLIRSLPKHTQSHYQFKYSTFLINLFDLILSNHFPLEQEKKELPKWFRHLCYQANDKDIFVKGVPALIKLSGKSNSYLCKCFNKYLDQTPSAFINDLRLLHAKTLLTDTDLSILDISLDCGYENLSHFYHLFKTKFHTTPNKYRKDNNEIYL